MGGPLVEALETQGVLNDGRKISYALGLVVDTYKGLRDVSHGGSTAGYQTFLARYPEKKVSVGVLCNGTSPFAGVVAAKLLLMKIFGPYPDRQRAGRRTGSGRTVEEVCRHLAEREVVFPAALFLRTGP